MKNISYRCGLMLGTLLLISTFYLNAAPRARKAPAAGQTIRLALLLDTSNSMDGLIEQAKSQLWKIVNDLSAARCQDGVAPQIRIALYEYGNSRLRESEGYIRMVSPMTGDLDLISEKLFSLTTNGGDEYCGQVIKTSINELEWKSATSDLNLIFIAGNEPFTQGHVPYATACALAKEKGIVVNTIFCGNFDEGLQTEWKRGADLTGGTYMSIDQNRKTVYIPTPYDDQIETKNDELNKTYVYYGADGLRSKANQAKQDENALSISRSNKVERAASKSGAAYTNKSWDLVDAAKENEAAVANVDEKDLPAEMKGMTIEKRKEYVKQKLEERSRVQSEIRALSKKRAEYIAAHRETKAGEVVLEDAMIKAIHQKGIEKKMSWK